MKNVKRILVIRIDFLGDMVCTTAFLHALKARWPTAEIHVLANTYNRSVLDGNPDVSAVHTYVYSKQCERNDRPGRLRSLVDRFNLILRLRRLKFDLLIVPNGGRHKNSIQFARQLGVTDSRWHDERSEFDDRVPEHAANRPIRHEALSGFMLVPELGEVDAHELKLHVYPDPSLRAQWLAALGPRRRPRVGLFVSNKAAERRWEARKWNRLASTLAEHADVIVFRDPRESAGADRSGIANVREVSPPTVPELIAAMSALDLVISADSAPVHLAAALGVPVVALFENRPEKWGRWHPLGVRHVVLREGRFVSDIGMEAVERAAISLLLAATMDDRG